MSDDLLERATRALRETSAEPNPRSGLTRARLLESAEKRGRSRRTSWLRGWVGLIALLGASTALARVAQQYWPEIKQAVAPAEQRQSVAARRKPPAPRPVPAAVPATDPAPVAVPLVLQPPAEPHVEPREPPEPSAPAPPPKRVRPKPRRAEPAPTPAPGPAPEAVAGPPGVRSDPPPVVESAELALFRRAQRLHLARDSAALGAWDDYLRVAEHGALVPEARYNRALCLVRAGQKAEARAALEPFARGGYGEYRRREAQALLDALSDDSR